MKKYIYILIILIVQHTIVQAQFNYGTAHSHFAPTQTVHHNPATLVNNGAWIDFHIAGAGFFLYNNYAYFPPGEFSIANFDNLGDPSFRDDRRRYGLFNKQEIHVLSITSQYKHHGFGFSIRGRNMNQVRRMPSEFISVALDDLGSGPNPFGSNGEFTNLSVNWLSYLEFGVSYANAFKRLDKDLWIMGGSLKYLRGLSSGGINLNNLYYSLSPNDNFNFIELTGRTGYANGTNVGMGAVIDYGIQYKKMLDNITHYDPFSKTSGCDQYRYKWKVGASITDLGLLRFNKDANFIKVTDASGVVNNFSRNIDSPSGAFDILNSQNNDGVEVSNSFLMLPPTAIHLQGDYNFENKLFLSAQYSYGFFRTRNLGIRHPDIITFVPRFEDKWFEFALPISMFNYEEIRLGAMVRLAYLTIGTDKLGTFLGVSNVTGADIYVALAYKFFKKPFCEKRTKTKNRNQTKCVK